MPKSMRVKTRFTADEDVSKTARKIEKNTQRMNRGMQRGFKQSRRSALQFKSVLKGILAAGAIQKGFGLLSQGVGEVARQFVSFDDAITAAAVRFKDIGPDAANFNEQLQIIRKSAREAGGSTIFTAEQSAKALDFLARAGFTSAEAMGSLGSMISLSVATGEDFAAVADMSSDLLGAFGLNANNTAKKIANLNRLNDVLVKTTNSANVTVSDMFETMKQVGPIATGVLGASLEEVSALTAVLGNSGIKGSDAMTALKNAYLRLAAPVGKGAKILKRFGISLKDGNGGAKKMTDIMLELRNKIKDFGKVPQAEILDAIFGKRAIAGGKNILDNIKNIKAFEETLKNAAGTSQKTAAIMQQSLGNQIKLLGSAFTDLGFSIITPFETNIKDMILSTTERLNKLSKVIQEISGDEKKLKTTPGSAADTRAALDALSAIQTGGGAPPKWLKAFADLTTTTFFGKSVEELRKEQGTRDTAFQDPMVQAFAKKGIAAYIAARVNPQFASERAHQLGLLQPEFTPRQNPAPVVNLETNINAEGVTAETTVKAPKSSNRTGANKF